MRPATDKQKALLKDLARNKQLSTMLKNKDLDGLSSKDASTLIDRCMKRIRPEKEQAKPEKPASKGYAVFDAVRLCEDEEAEIRRRHREHCKKIMKECIKDFPDDKDLATAVFSKRADKIFTWMQRAKAEKQAESQD